jgi:hypothetical protein
MSIIGSYRLFNSLDNGSLTGAQLNTLLAGSRELAEFRQLCDTPQAASALAASPTAVAAIGQSAIATQVVYENRRNFDVVARQRLSAFSVTFLEEFFFSETLETAASNTVATTIFNKDGKFFIGHNNGVITAMDGAGKAVLGASTGVNNLLAIAFGNGVYVAVAGGTNFVHSADGLRWTITTISNQSWSDVTFGNGVFVAVGSNPAAATSTNGVAWSTRTIPSGSWQNVTFGNGVFVAVGTNVVATSPDGITWTTRTIPSGSWQSVTFGNGVFVAVGTNVAATSPDGITWTTRTIGSFNFRAVAFGGGLFVATSGGDTDIAISRDGITWTLKRLSAFVANVSGGKRLAYGNGMFVMTTGVNGTVQRSISSVFP